MSFDVLFHTCNLGIDKKRVKNPFTGASMITFEDPGLSEDEREGIAKLLTGLKAKGPDEFDTYSLSFADGGEADLIAGGLEAEGKFESCSVQTRILTPDVALFIFRLSRAGNMVITPVAEGVGSLVTSEEQQQRVSARFPAVKLIRSAAALERELRSPFEMGQQYRDQVVGDKE